MVVEKIMTTSRLQIQIQDLSIILEILVLRFGCVVIVKDKTIQTRLS